MNPNAQPTRVESFDRSALAFFSNRRIRTRTYGGVGGAEPRGSPLSRSLAQSGSRSKACGRLKVIRVVFAVGRLLPIYLQLQTCRPTCANRGDWAHEWTSSNLAAVGANAQASSISLVASGPLEQCTSQQAASRGSDPG